MNIFDITIWGVHIAPKWYGLMYAISFFIGYQIARKHRFFRDNEHLEIFVLYMLVGVIGGGRIGHVLFYDWTYYSHHISEIFMPWLGGMSFHGGLIGVLLVSLAFCKKYQYNFFLLGDLLAYILPIGLGLGRIGNYLNKELLGFPYNGPLAVHTSTGSFFPSPLLEAFFEGLLLFWIVYIFRKSVYYRFAGQVGGIFLLGYGVLRCIAEYTKELDTSRWIIDGLLSKGQALSLPMILCGILLLTYYKRYPLKDTLGR